MQATAGTIIDDQFEILSVIGTGGFGVVYRARQINLDRVVALKMLDAEIAEDSSVRQRFELEARALCTLKHRNLVMVYGCGFWQGRPYINMEFVNGVSLQQVLDEEERLEEKRALRIVRQILDGLDCAHKHDIVHRDLKPSNIMILQRGPEELVKIIDFGLAKVIPGGGIAVQKLTEVGFAVGSVMYMAPEQCMGKEVDCRCDLYATGCILHRCLTGAHPYEGAHSAVVMMQHLQATPKLLSECLAEGAYSSELQPVLNKALAKLPAERYQSAAQMASDLMLIASDRSGEISCRNAEVPQSLESDCKNEARVQWNSPFGFIVAALVILLAVGTYYTYSSCTQVSSTLLFKRAKDLWTAGKKESAIRTFEQCVAQRKSDGLLGPFAYCNAALKLADWYGPYSREKALEIAEPALQNVIDKNATVNDTVMGLASTYQYCCNSLLVPTRGMARCEKILEQSVAPLSGGAKERLESTMAEGYAAMGRPMKAADMLDRAQGKGGVANDKGWMARNLICRGEVVFLMGNMKEAESFFESSRRVCDQPYLVLPDLIRTKIALGDFEGAEKLYSEYTKTGAKGSSIIGVKALLKAHAGEFAEARAIIKPLCLKVKETPDAFKALHLDTDLIKLEEMAAKNKEFADWFSYWYRMDCTLYVRHLQMFKQVG